MSSEFIKSEARRVYECIRRGGVAIIALDVGYAIGSHSRESVERVLKAKRRPPSKINGSPGNLELSSEVHLLEGRQHDMVRAITQDHNLPLTLCAPCRADHPYMRAFDPWVLEKSTLEGTFSLLVNGGPLLNEVVPMCVDNLCPIVGSSANVSLKGTNFSLESIEPELRAAADVETNLGLSKYYNSEGMGSTILAMPSFEVIRFGIFYEKIRDILKRDFNQDLPERGRFIHKDQALAAAGLEK